jgi:hypothetical protein
VDEHTSTDRVQKEPPKEHADVCLLCNEPIVPNNRVVRMHGVWMHRIRYQKDLDA